MSLKINARTVLAEEKLIEIDTKLGKVKWDVVDLSEVRRVGSGKGKICSI